MAEQAIKKSFVSGLLWEFPEEPINLGANTVGHKNILSLYSRFTCASSKFLEISSMLMTSICGSCIAG